MQGWGAHMGDFQISQRSDPLVLANLLRHWQDLCFLTSGIPICTFQADFTIFTDASMQGWGAHIGDSQISGSFVYQQARRDPFPHLVTFDSRASPLVRGSEHNSLSKAYSRLSERDSRPPIASEWANIDRVVPPPRDHGTYLQALGDTRSLHVCDSVEQPPSSVHVSSSVATSPSGGCSVSGLAGEVNVHFPPFILLNKVNQKLRSTQAAEVILVAPWWLKQSWFPNLLHLCVDHPLCFPYRRDLLSQQDQKCLGRKVIPSALILALMRHYKAASFSDGVSRLAAAYDVRCTTIGGFASLIGPQGKGLIHLIPQLLR